MKYMALAVLGIALGGACSASALESNALNPLVKATDATGKIQQSTSSNVVPGSNSLMVDLQKIMDCAKTGQTYNSTTGLCSTNDAGGGGGSVVPSELTGPFSQIFSTPGTYTFNVPATYTGMSVYVYGGGGACDAGQTSSFGSPTPVIAYGGGNATQCTTWYSTNNTFTAAKCSGANGAPGGTANGDYSSPGSGSTGAMTCLGMGAYPTLNGGGGGYTRKDFIPGAPGAPAPGSNITVVVGNGAKKGQTPYAVRGVTYYSYRGQDASPGKVTIYWMKSGS